MIEQLTEDERAELRSDGKSGPRALRIIDAQAARIADLERECTDHVLGWSGCQSRLDAATAEMERLREEVERLRLMQKPWARYADAVRRQLDAESRTAAANALLQKCRRVLPKMGRDADYIGVDALVATIDAHLEATK